uniref:Repressor of RNA polymerase III transcription n=1 Tax=Hemiselmis andersenii TaxID=464988 RepID=A0A6T8GCU1_HEMAN|mmetsp:Transcript_35553/g.83266  ORF Transcript_35553/g.83266 Transcript_35553/m.83266 type:complete len:245 (+) Transcript_35553:254-988(+)
MKYLECPPISELDLRLHSGIIVGDYKVNGRVEIYSCKLAPSEKRLANSLDKQLAVELGGSHSVGSLEDSPLGGSFGNPFHPGHSSLSPASASPLGSVNDSATRKLLINLILTLNNTFSDYDFRDLKPEDFIREGSLDLVQNSINSKLSRGEDSSNVEFYQRLWSSLDDEMSLKECEIYSYVNDMDDDALSVGKIWSVNYFLYNKKLKKLAFLACWIKTPGMGQEDSDEGMESDDEGVWAMDTQD